MQNLQKNTITKGAIALGLSAILASSAIAEDDGAFVGLEVGLTSVKAEAKATSPVPITNTAKDILPSLAIKGGYKWFFGDSKRFGTRAYGMIGAGTGSLTQLTSTLPTGATSFITGTQHTYYTTYLDYYGGCGRTFKLR
ncbi:outer membrane beta-barrel protein [Helicobacter sp. 23-1048]